ncbi:MAG TPA: aminoglycoside phosphotransferase family protein, partial [Chloroflexota bacterium]|nr:aminoglycoside phosphotransferase family protein [Chloroflexota bacterium]
MPNRTAPSLHRASLDEIARAHDTNTKVTGMQVEPTPPLGTGLLLHDEYVQPDAPDPVLDGASVLQLARRHVSEAQEVLAVDESGGEARTYFITTPSKRVVVKVQRPHRVRARTGQEKEAFFLQYLATHGRDDPFPVPRLFGHGREVLPAGADGTSLLMEYTVMSHIPGRAIQHTTLKGPMRQAALADLGTVLRRIHALPQAPLAESGLFPGDRCDDDLATRLEVPAAGAVSRLHQTGAERLLPESAEALVRHVIRALPRGGPRVALHANPGPMHTFVDPRTGAFTGLIDFGDAYISHPALDLRRWDWHEDRLALLEGYQRDGAVGEDFLQTWRVAVV